MQDRRDARDYAEMVDLAIDILNHPKPDRPWQPVLDGLVRRLDGCGAVLCRLHQATPGGARYTGTVEAVNPCELHTLPLDGLLGEAAVNDPLIQHYLTTGDFEPRATGDVVSMRAWRSTVSFVRARETMGANSCVSLPLVPGSNGHQAITVTLQTTSVAEREIRFLRQVQPLVVAVDRHLHHLDRWRRGTSGLLRTGGPGADGGLTPRELTVLTLLAEAHTASAIGRHLGISPRTVQKHVQNVYRKMGTTDRVSTILRAQRIGLLP